MSSVLGISRRARTALSSASRTEGRLGVHTEREGQALSNLSHGGTNSRRVPSVSSKMPVTSALFSVNSNSSALRKLSTASCRAFLGLVKTPVAHNQQSRLPSSQHRARPHEQSVEDSNYALQSRASEILHAVNILQQASRVSGCNRTREPNRNPVESAEPTSGRCSGRLPNVAGGTAVTSRSTKKGRNVLHPNGFKSCCSAADVALLHVLKQPM